MAAIRLEERAVEKVWGRPTLPPPFADRSGAEPIGEIWFEMPDRSEPELLVKYLFTSEKLSVQVHPDDAEAQARGLRNGKEECWLVIAAEPDATIGVGLTRDVTSAELRQAALEGSIEQLVDWKRVQPGDFFYSPAGTVHAIGAGVSVIEVQQYADVTYRLYDYGRPRELHLDDGIAVSDPEPYRAPFEPREAGPGRRIMAAGRKFVLEKWNAPAGGLVEASAERPTWIVPVAGEATLDGTALKAGEVWLANSDVAVTVGEGGEVLIAYPGAEVR